MKNVLYKIFEVALECIAIVITFILIALAIIMLFDIVDTDKKPISSQFTELQEYDDNSGLCYDKATKIIYVYSYNDENKNYSYSPYYCMGADNEPKVAIYYEGMDLIEEN